MFYAGITKVLDPEWTAKGYIESAKTFPSFYNWLLSDNILPIVDLLNQWGLTLIGVSLILGLFVRWSSLFGAIIMVLYYIPVLDFPYISSNYFIIDNHIIYVLVFIILCLFGAGQYWGFDGYRKYKK